MLIEIISFILMVFIAPFLFPKNHWSRYYVCYFSFCFIAMAIPVVFFPFMICSAKLGSRIFMAVSSLGDIVLRMNLESRGLENIRKLKTGIIVVNHQSLLDTVALMRHNGGLDTMMAVIKKEAFIAFPISIYLWYIGNVFIDRKNPKSAYEKMSKALEKKDKKLLIFPEGTRNKIGGTNFLPFKIGAFKLAIKHKIPLIPTVISPYTFIQRGKQFSQGRLIISSLPPIETKDLTEKDIPDLIAKTKDLMFAEYCQLSKELQN